MNVLLLIVLAAVVLVCFLVVMTLVLLQKLGGRVDETAQRLTGVEAGFGARLEALNGILKSLDGRLISGLTAGQEAGIKQTEAVTKVLTDNRSELDRRLAENQKMLTTLAEKIGQVDQASKSLTESVRQIDELRRLLAKPGGRGPLGEAVLLETLLDVLPQKYVEKQRQFNDKTRVDLTIQVGERFVPIDSKFALEDYRTFVNATSEDEKKTARTAFLRRVKQHVDSVAKYIKVDEGTYPFALMYLPSEAVFLEAAADEDTARYARSKAVVPVSPGSFLAYLEVILEGLKGFEVEKRAKLIVEQVREVERLVRILAESHRILSGHIADSAKSAQEVGKGIQKVAGAVDAIQMPDDVEPDGR